MRKLLSLTLVIMLSLALLAGCSTADPKESPSPSVPAAESPSPTIAVTTPESNPTTPDVPAATPQQPTIDRAGNPITPPAAINSIISLAPAITKTLIHLGLADKLVAVDSNSITYEGLKPGITVVDMLAPDGEQLLTLGADLALCSAMTGYDGSEPLRPLIDLGTCVAAIPSSSSIQGIRDDILFIADLVMMHDEGAEIVAQLDAGIQAVRDAVGSAPKKTVYFEISAAPWMYSFGSGTFMNEMIEIAGGENILADIEGWISVSEEQIIDRNPDVIFTNINYIDAPVDEILSRDALQGVTAVKNHDVYQIDADSSSQSNEYIFEAIAEMAAALHPDLWQNG